MAAPSVARLLVLAKKYEPQWQERAFQHLDAAVAQGLPRSFLKADRILSPLHGDRFNRLIEQSALQSPQVLLPRILDPLQDN